MQMGSNIKKKSVLVSTHLKYCFTKLHKSDLKPQLANILPLKMQLCWCESQKIYNALQYSMQQFVYRALHGPEVTLKNPTYLH